jgi:hypothetical protein
MDSKPSSSGYHCAGQSWQPKSQRAVQRILEQRADLVIGSDKLDAAIAASLAQQITHAELVQLVYDIERGLTA